MSKPQSQAMARPLAPVTPAFDAPQTADEQRVHQAIVDAVLSQQLPPGTRLVETPLCEAFGVNRSLLRRVFVRLANERVIELHHNRGASVAQPSQHEMHEVFDVRRVVEAGIVRRLCRCAEPAMMDSWRSMANSRHNAQPPART